MCNGQLLDSIIETRCVTSARDGNNFCKTRLLAVTIEYIFHRGKTRWRTSAIICKILERADKAEKDVRERVFHLSMKLKVGMYITIFT